MLRQDYTLYRSRLVLRPGDEEHLRRLAGLARFAYNWALDLQEAQLQAELPLLDAKELEARFWEETRRPGQEWLRQLPSDVWRNALKDLLRGYDLWERQTQQNTNKGYTRNRPQRKRRGHSKTSYALSRFSIETRMEKGKRHHRITTRGFTYELHRSDAMPEFLERPYRATVKELDGLWFITLHYREPRVLIRPQGPTIGVDMGFKTMAVDSEGNSHEFRELPRGAHERMLHLRRVLRRTRPGSRSHQRIQGKLDRLRYRQRRIEWDCQHQAAAHILRVSLPASERPAQVIIDHLNLTEIAKSSQTLDEAVRTQHLYQLFLKLRAKAEKQGTEFIEAAKAYPSSKTCSDCGHINWKLQLGDRTYRCSSCGLVLDRDENAARNLRDYQEDWQAVIDGKRQRWQAAEFERHEFDQFQEPVMSETESPARTITTIPDELEDQLEALSRRRASKTAASPSGDGTQRLGRPHPASQRREPWQRP
jgi:putative transposase